MNETAERLSVWDFIGDFIIVGLIFLLSFILFKSF